MRKRRPIWWNLVAGSAAILLVWLLITSWASPSKGAHPSTGPPPAAAPAGPCAGYYSQQVIKRPHYDVYDAVVTGDEFGPEVSGRTAPEILGVLQTRACYNSALLVDLTNHALYGIEPHVSVASRRQEIESLNQGPGAAWDQKVNALMAIVRSGAHIEPRDGAYRSWWYKPGPLPTDIPALYTGNAPARQSVYLVYTKKGSGTRYLRLECDFQPSDPLS